MDTTCSLKLRLIKFAHQVGMVVQAAGLEDGYLKNQPRSFSFGRLRRITGTLPLMALPLHLRRRSSLNAHQKDHKGALVTWYDISVQYLIAYLSYCSLERDGTIVLLATQD